MKRILIASILLAAINICKAQVATVTKSTLNEYTIVKDSLGNTLTYETWNKALKTGNYYVRSGPGKNNTVYILHYLTSVEKARFAKLRSSLASTQQNDSASVQAPVASSVTLEQPRKYTPTRLPRQSDSFKNGQAFKPFKDKDINGERIDIAALKGKIVVLNFWFINCPACREEMPELNALVADYADDKDVIFIGLSLDQKQTIKDFIKEMPFNFKHIPDARYYGDKYGVNLYPTTLVLDKEGIIRFNLVGSDNTAYWIKKTIRDINNAN